MNALHKDASHLVARVDEHINGLLPQRDDTLKALEYGAVEIIPKPRVDSVFGLEHGVLVPNAMLSEMEVHKVSAHPGLRVQGTLSLSTTTEQNALAMELIKRTLAENADARLIFVRHNGFKGQGFEIIYLYDVTEFKNRNRVMYEVQLRLAELCGEAGITFSRTPVSVEMMSKLPLKLSPGVKAVKAAEDQLAPEPQS